MADEGDLLRAHLIVRGAEIPTHGRRDAEDFEKFIRDVGAGVTLWVAVHRHVYRRAIDVSGEQREGALPFAHRHVIEPVDLAAEAIRVRVFLGEVDDLYAGEAFGIRKRKAAQHRAVDHAERRGDGRDAEREHEDRESAETLFLDQHT